MWWSNKYYDGDKVDTISEEMYIHGDEEKCSYQEWYANNEGYYDFHVVMFDDEGKLYSFYSTPYEGREGSYEELLEEYDDMHPEDQEFLVGLEKYYNFERTYNEA